MSSQTPIYPITSFFLSLSQNLSYYMGYLLNHRLHQNCSSISGFEVYWEIETKVTRNIKTAKLYFAKFYLIYLLIWIFVKAVIPKQSKEYRIDRRINVSLGGEIKVFFC